MSACISCSEVYSAYPPRNHHEHYPISSFTPSPPLFTTYNTGVQVTTGSVVSSSTIASVSDPPSASATTLDSTSSSSTPFTSSLNNPTFSSRTVASTASLLISSSTSPTSSSSTVNHNVSPSAVDVLAHKTNKGAIAGGVVGGCLALLALLGILFLWLRMHRRRSRVAPSTEFMSGKVVPISPGFTTRQARLPLVARQPSLEDEQPPPPFTPGSYTDPIYEKVLSAKAQRQEYEAYDRVRQSTESWGKAEKGFLIE